MNPILNCPSLAGKPKLIFVQSCRGSYNEEQGIVPDAVTENGRHFHNTKDTFIMYAAAPGNVAWATSGVTITSLLSNDEYI